MLQRLFREQPTIIWLSLTAIAWLFSTWVLLHADHAAHHCASQTRALCAGPLDTISSYGADQALMWLLMIGAMISLLLRPFIRYVAVRSFPARRIDMVASLIAGYIFVWGFAAGLATLVLLALLRTGTEASVVAGGSLLVAAAWQIGPVKRWALEYCHRSFAVQANGCAATLSCLRFGVRHGFYCALACLPMMAAAMWAQQHVAAMFVVGAISLYERAARDPKLLHTSGVLVLLAMFDAL